MSDGNPLTRWPEAIMQLSERAEAIITDLEDLAIYWSPLDSRKALVLRDLLQTISKLDRELNEFAAMNHEGLRGESFLKDDFRDFRSESNSVLDGPFEVNCCNCGVAFCTRYLSFYETAIEHRDFKMHAKHLGVYCLVSLVQTNFDSKGRDRRWRSYPCCSEDCQLMLERKLEFHQIRRDEEWQAIKESKKLLREARVWLRERKPKLHAVSPSQAKE